VDGALHAIAFAPQDALGGGFMTAPAQSAMEAFQTSAFSLKALSAALAPLMPEGSGIVGMDFDASVAWPIYDWMGVAKAALESVSRYLARDLGPKGIRVNLVSAGPLGTVAARGIPGFEQLADLWSTQAPLGWDIADPVPVARAVCWLLSDYSHAISGEIVHVDGGFHAVGAPSSS
jgi:enoyl ACP reductase